MKIWCFLSRNSNSHLSKWASFCAKPGNVGLLKNNLCWKITCHFGKRPITNSNYTENQASETSLSLTVKSPYCSDMYTGKPNGGWMFLTLQRENHWNNSSADIIKHMQTWKGTRRVFFILVQLSRKCKRKLSFFTAWWFYFSHHYLFILQLYQLTCRLCSMLLKHNDVTSMIV